MVAHITALHVRPGTMNEVVNIYMDEIIPLVQRQTGCRFVTLLTDASSDQVVAICWWERETDLLAGQSDSRYQQQMAQIGPILLASPVCTAYQVSLQVAPI